jgi:4-hydroxy-tetrahydrodipicolinate reductase
MEEIHHTQKLDAPSGTAISLANGIIENSDYIDWSLDKNSNENNIYIDAQRIENVAGIHSVFYTSAVDTIEIKHSAHSRDGFAFGSVIAAEWLLGKKGVFTMRDVLELK